MTDNTISSPIPGATIITSDGQVTQNPDTNDEKVLDAEVTDLATSDTDTEFDTQQFESIKALVTRKATAADEMRQKIKELSEGLKNILINDRELSDAEDQGKKLKKQVTQRRTQLMSSQEAVSIKLKLQEAKEDLKDLEDSLSTQLLSLFQITGVQEFETEDGDVREFVIKAKVKAKRKK